MKKRPLLEVCVDGPTGLLAAVNAGADRIELCAALALSGLTPSPGLMALATELAVSVHAMIRPRPGDFRYSADEIDVMRRDIDAVRAAGLTGVVLGANEQFGNLDERVLRRLIDHANGLSITLHRAFDLVPDFDAALEAAIELGFDRLLTSGGAATAILGAERIAELVQQARGRIVVMAGAGVNSGNVDELIRRTGVNEVHASCGAPIEPFGEDQALAEKAASLGFTSVNMRDTDSVLVAELVIAISRITRP